METCWCHATTWRETMQQRLTEARLTLTERPKLSAYSVFVVTLSHSVWSMYIGSRALSLLGVSYSDSHIFIILSSRFLLTLPWSYFIDNISVELCQHRCVSGAAFTLMGPADLRGQLWTGQWRSFGFTREVDGLGCRTLFRRRVGVRPFLQHGTAAAF